MNKELTFVEHLEELRRRLMISAISIALAGIFAFPFASNILKVLRSPASDTIGALVFFAPADAFLIHLKIAFFIGLAVSIPVILCQLWAFISPAIEINTKRAGLLFLLSSLGAFALGAGFGFFVLLPAAIKFLLSFSQGTLQPLISASSYISFVLGLTLGCGIVFEMPVLSFLLSKAGIIDCYFLRKARKFAAIAIFITAAIITPTPDIFNMTVMAIPMFFLYELSIWVSMLSRRKRRSTSPSN